MSHEDRVESLPEFREVAERALVDTDVSDHLLTIFREGLAAHPRLVVELGVRSGESTFVLERVAQLANATLVSVDIEDCPRVSTCPRVHFVRSDDVAFASEFPAWCRARGIEPEVDVLFVDTSHEHEHTRREIAAWFPHLSKSARAIFHDTNLKRVVRRRDGRVHACPFEQRGVTRALEELLGVPLDETRDFTLVRNEWTVRHDSCCHGLTVLERGAVPAIHSAAGTRKEVKPIALVFCERIDNESFCESIIRELAATHEVRVCGPGWPAKDLDDLDTRGARFYLELDAASGSFVRPQGLERLSIPKFAWLIDTHKKPSFHAEIARDMDLTFYAHKVWGHVFKTPAAWLPLHADQAIFRPIVDCARDLDLVFVGSQEWRVDPLRRIAEKHGLSLHVSCTTGPREKSETAALYARAKLVFNRHCANDLNFRVFEAMSCGRVVLTDAQWNGQYDLFEDGRHYVLYKDERDLERQVLFYLRDEVARARIEREAGALASKDHTTRARVGALIQTIEEVLAQRRLAAPLAGTEGRNSAATAKRRLIFFTDDEPATVERRTHAERVAWGLACGGHDVFVARLRRGVFPSRGASLGEPKVVELDPGPLPDALTIPNRLLTVAAALHTRFDALVREHGPFDVLVGEGPLGGFVVEPTAARLGVPFHFALQDCVVAKHGNRLTREQVNLAELEHWFVDRAKAVLVPSKDVADAVCKYYPNDRTRILEPPPPQVRAPRDLERLVARLGLGLRGYILVLSPHEGEREKAALLGGEPRHAVVLLTNDLRVRFPGGEVRILSRVAPRGSALAALLVGSEGVVALRAQDPRVAEARALACRVAVLDAGVAVASGAVAFERALAQTDPVRLAPPSTEDHDSLFRPFLALLPERKEAELAGVQ